jgi:hypothetical protein
MNTMMTEEPTPQCKSILKTGSANKKGDPCNVSFRNHAELVYIETVDELTADELAATYYRDYEYQQIKAGNKILIKRLKNGEPCEETEKICYRGLEHKTDEKSRRRRHSRFEAAMAAYDEQMRQQDEGVVDEDLIRDAYEAETFMSQEIAQEIGVRDSMEAERCWRQSQDTEPTPRIVPEFIPEESIFVAKSYYCSIGSKPISSTASSTHFKGIVGLVVSTQPQRAR